MSQSDSTSPYARILLAAALVAGLGGALGVGAGPVMLAAAGAAPTSGSADPAPWGAPMHGDRSVPDAGIALAGRADRYDEPAPTF